MNESKKQDINLAGARDLLRAYAESYSAISAEAHAAGEYELSIIAAEKEAQINDAIEALREAEKALARSAGNPRQARSDLRPPAGNRGLAYLGLAVPIVFFVVLLALWAGMIVGGR